MLRLTRELVNQGFDSRQQLMELLMQINLMESYATLQGMPIHQDLAKKLAQLSGCIKTPENRKPSEELKAMDDDSIEKSIALAFEVHGRLSELVKPATPESLEASAPRGGLARLTWPRVTDVLIATTFVAVAACAIGWGAGTKSTATEVLTAAQRGFQQVAYLGAALLGASFCGLYTAYKYVQNRTFDPASGSSYMVRVVLGTVSGLILANIGNVVVGKIAPGQQDTGLGALGPGTLALIGGYSADAVNLILQRIAETLVTTVRGNADDSLKAKQAQLEAESKTADFLQRQATVVALSHMLKNATDDTMKNNLQTLMAEVGQGTVGANVLLPVQTNGGGNGSGKLDLSGEPHKPVDSVAANSEAVKAEQEASNNNAVPLVPDETPVPESLDMPEPEFVSVGAEDLKPPVSN